MQIKRVWSAYLRGTLALMFIVGLVFTIVYLAIGLPGALIIGILAGLLSLIPELGPFISAVIAASVALVEGSYYLSLSNFWFAVLVVIIYIILINLKGLWLRPRIMGRSVHLHEGLVFVAIMAAIIFQGILGALIVIPVLASAVVIARYLRRRILGQSPFLNPGKNIFDNPVEVKKYRFPMKKKINGEN
jgi:predicted PurR-regulated permease PerM